MFVAGLGVPGDAIDALPPTTTSSSSTCAARSRHAVAAVDAGCDLVVAQGTEAGGHTGQVATLPLVPQIVDAVGDRVPVVAAGGIFDGRGLAAALTLGADGVWVGTRFIATPEARAVAGLQGRAARHGRGRHGRLAGVHGQDAAGRCATRTRWHFEEHPEEPAPFPHAAGPLDRAPAPCTSAPTSRPPGVDPDRECYPAGQGVGAIHDLVPAGELVRALRRRGGAAALARARGARV